MARRIIGNRVDDPEAVKKSTADGYPFRANDSTATEWLFTRSQPPLKNPQNISRCPISLASCSPSLRASLTAFDTG